MKTLWWRLIEFSFRLLYNEFAWTYDVVSGVVSLGDWRKWQKAGLQFIQGEWVLEIAHGPGHMLVALAEAEFTAIGCDLSPAMGRMASKRLRKRGLTVPLFRCDVKALPLVDGSVDSVLSTFPTSFIMQRQTWETVHRVLRPGGAFIIVPEGHVTGTGFIARFIRWLFVITGQYAADRSTMWKPFRQRLERQGFAVRIEEVHFNRSAATVIIATKQ